MHRERQVFLGVYVDDFHMAGKSKKLAGAWEPYENTSRSEILTSSTEPRTWDVHRSHATST